MAALLGVTDRAILHWRRGLRRPSGANILAITELARSIPGGCDVMTDPRRRRADRRPGRREL